MLNPATYHLVKDEYEADINRIWKFLAENVILPGGNNMNKHQTFIKEKSINNYKERQEIKLQEQKEAKEAFKLSLRKNENMLNTITALTGKNEFEHRNERSKILARVEEI